MWLVLAMLCHTTAIQAVAGETLRLPHEPVAWTNRTAEGGRVKYTSLGHSSDFRLPAFQRLLLNGIRWAVASERGSATPSDPQPLSVAHAHNDYHHTRPLWDALELGFCNVEADVFLVDHELLVGHSRGELKADRTLQSLYLEPLQSRARAHGGRIYPAGPVFTLLVDIKSEAAPTYQALRKLLAQYADILSVFRDGHWSEKAVTVVVSGNRPQDLIAQDDLRYVGIDGRVSDLGNSMPGHLMPWISDRWSGHFTWNGQGPMPSGERMRLSEIVTQAHAADRRVRFWATPENPQVWSELLAAQVDLIGTDQLAELSRFLREQRSTSD